MTATIVTGMDPGGDLYQATLNGDMVPVRLQPDALLVYTPDQGAPVVAGPVGVQVSFDVDDPAAVYAWLLGSTDVLSVEGPNLLPSVPGDLILDDDNPGPPDDGEPTEPPPPDTTEPAHLANTQPEEGAMADTATIEQPEAPTVEVIEETPDEMKVRFPVLVIEGLDTSDGRYLEADSLTHRALPLSLLAQPEASHGGDEPGPSVVIGRLDTMTRTPGPEVISKRTGEPFPEGTFVWSATGAIDANHPVADLVRRGYLRGVSVDLAGMDYDVLGMLADDEDGLPIDPENPRRQLVTHSAEIAAATLVPIPAFGDAYVELDSEDVAPEPVAAEDLPEGLLASAVPSWRSSEVGDLVPVLTAAADEGMPVRIPPDSVEQLAAVIDTGTDRDATELATAIVEHIATTWALDEPVTEAELPTDAVTAAGEEPMDDQVAEVDDDEGFPESPQPCQYGPEAAVESLVFREGDAYVPTCADHKKQAEAELAAAGEVVAEVVPIEQGDDPEAVLADGPEDLPEVDDDAGMPDAPQPCEFGDHPATMSLLFGSDQYAAVCLEHEQQGRDEIAARGDDVTGVVEIEQPAENEETS
jgi:hypothetical protein